MEAPVAISGLVYPSYGHGPSDPPPSSLPASTFNQDAMWQLNLRSTKTSEFAPYPERPGEPDCSYYITRTMYYLKTGTCKFGATCKFHHPRDKAGIAGRATLNILGYPFRPNENECSCYLRKGECKFGSTCKFHHPQPSNMMVSVRGSPAYPSVNSPTDPNPQSYPGGVTNWPMSRASFIPSPRWQGASNYSPLILPPGVVSIPGWNAYSGQMASMSSTEGQRQAVGDNQVYGTTRQSEATDSGSQGLYSQYRAGAVPIGMYARENVFPERPGQPECQFYMKTGDCKFRAVCRFHHPRERVIPAPDCKLSPLGLPLRQGEPFCVFYSRYSICKFDHPMGIFKFDVKSFREECLCGITYQYHGYESNKRLLLYKEQNMHKPRIMSLEQQNCITISHHCVHSFGRQ